MKIKKSLIIALFFCFMAGCEKNDYIDQGTAYLKEYAYDEAITSFENALNDGENKTLSYRGAGIAFLGKRDYAEALNCLSKALEYKTASNKEVRKDILYYTAAAYYGEENLEGAIETYGEILEIDSELDAYYLRGKCYLEQEKVDEAEADFGHAIREEDENYDLYIDIYESFVQMEMEEMGFEYLEKALIGLKGSEDRYQIGRVSYYMGDYENARTQLNKAAEEGNSDAALLLGEVYIALGERVNALSLYETYIENYGASPRVYNGIALIHIEDGNYETALEAIKKGSDLPEEDGKQELLFNEIVAYEKLLDFETAKEKAEEYVSRYPDDMSGKKEYELLKTR